MGKVRPKFFKISYTTKDGDRKSIYSSKQLNAIIYANQLFARGFKDVSFSKGKVYK